MFVEHHINYYIVKNLNTGKEYEFLDYKKAYDFLVDLRLEKQDFATIKMYAVLDD